VSIYAHSGSHPPFSVFSTGTWVICMATGGTPVTQDAARDRRVNVTALDAPVPSARLMGGREFDAIMQATATDRPVIASPAQTGTAVGAALLFQPKDLAASRPTETPILPDPAPAAYAARWRELVRS
jgi:hypothetical protein